MPCLSRRGRGGAHGLTGRLDGFDRNMKLVGGKGRHTTAASGMEGIDGCVDRSSDSVVTTYVI